MMASRFWVGGTGNWDASDTTHWAASSGGAGGQSVPGGGDAVTFNASSGGGTVTVNTDFSVTSLTMGAFTGTLDFSVNNNSPTMDSFSGTGAGVRSLKMGSGTWTFTVTFGTCWDMTTTTNLTFLAGTSTIKIIDTGTGTIVFKGGGLTYNNFWSSRGTATGGCQFTGSNTFNDFRDSGTGTHTLFFNNGTTQTVTTFRVSGILGHNIRLGNDVGTNTYALVKAGGGIVSCDYLTIAHCVATPADTWYAGGNSVNNQNIATAGSGWTFAQQPSRLAKIQAAENRVAYDIRYCVSCRKFIPPNDYGFTKCTDCSNKSPVINREPQSNLAKLMKGMAAIKPALRAESKPLPKPPPKPKDIYVKFAEDKP